MTEVAFYFNVDNKGGYACRLLRKAFLKGSRVVVTGEPALLEQIDRDLWSFSDVDFVPHCMAPRDADLVAASPVVLCASPDMSPHQQVLVNVGAGVPVGFERFERLIEIVGQDDADRQVSRRRWKHYRDRGYAIASHEIAARGVD